jgi:hypothetical protein
MQCGIPQTLLYFFFILLLPYHTGTRHEFFTKLSTEHAPCFDIYKPWFRANHKIQRRRDEVCRHLIKPSVQRNPKQKVIWNDHPQGTRYAGMPQDSSLLFFTTLPN